MIQTMKFLIEKPSPLLILILFGPKYLPQDPLFKYSSLFHLLVKETIFQSHTAQQGKKVKDYFMHLFSL